MKQELDQVRSALAIAKEENSAQCELGLLVYMQAVSCFLTGCVSKVTDSLTEELQESQSSPTFLLQEKSALRQQTKVGGGEGMDGDFR